MSAENGEQQPDGRGHKWASLTPALAFALLPQESFPVPEGRWNRLGEYRLFFGSPAMTGIAITAHAGHPFKPALPHRIQ